MHKALDTNGTLEIAKVGRQYWKNKNKTVKLQTIYVRQQRRRVILVSVCKFLVSGKFKVMVETGTPVLKELCCAVFMLSCWPLSQRASTGLWCFAHRGHRGSPCCSSPTAFIPDPCLPSSPPSPQIVPTLDFMSCLFPYLLFPDSLRSLPSFSQSCLASQPTATCTHRGNVRCLSESCLLHLTWFPLAANFLEMSWFHF